ncbi:AEC family transporter [Neisseria wadsworthii]|uniref:AEC family malonate efflux carrier n=1 Tax=Neisseria wadsworthii 9715 TaxID=1030841 RepID=G4CLS5_9NEIS|nr:AEC family transporter [Neisseria wadsworthii]EGZ51283.1 AEC family malonate efflux carrier [Neisseria wadsworthii 9715]QMT36119.1 AEC family transporter [Neisseria wadsworthii]
MTGIFDAFLFALGVTLPNFLLLVFGWYLRRSGQIDAHFCAQASKLVFRYGLPCVLFVSLMKSEVHYQEQLMLVAAGAVSTLVLFLAAELYAWKRVPQLRDKGVFVQGVFRSNLGIIGLAFVSNAYGAPGLAAGAVYTGVITILYNILAVVTLSRSAEGSIGRRIKDTVKKIMTNPLILAIVAAMLLQRFDIAIPKTVMRMGGYLADIALPLALICAGATFDIRSVIHASDISMQASIGRLIVAPVVAVAVGLAFGFSGIPMGVLFLMTATPVASASYVMAKSMGGNDVAAANITGITTAGAIFSAVAGMVWLRSAGLM